MHIPDYGAISRHLTLVASDPALTYQFRAAHPELIDLFREVSGANDPAPVKLAALPGSGDITALQATVFDNWKFKQRGQRWGMNLKAWTVPKITFGRTPANWSANVTFWDRDEALKKAKALQSPKLKNPISADTVGMIEDLLSHQPTGFFGLMKHMNPADGTHFYERHAVWLNVGEGPTECFIYTPNLAGWLPEFSSTDASGNALRDKATFQSRHSSLDAFAGWNTGESDL